MYMYVEVTIVNLVEAIFFSEVLIYLIINFAKINQSMNILTAI